MIAMGYWVLRLGDGYLDWFGRIVPRKDAYHFFTREGAKMIASVCPTPGVRLVRVVPKRKKTGDACRAPLFKHEPCKACKGTGNVVVPDICDPDFALEEPKS